MERGLVLIRDSGPTPWDSELPVLEAGAGRVLLLRVRRKEAPGASWLCHPGDHPFSRCWEVLPTEPR